MREKATCRLNDSSEVISSMRPSWTIAPPSMTYPRLASETGQADVLLHQQDRGPQVLRDRLQHASQLLDDAWLDAF